jgi:lipopolysaccharide biosynthesis glycosyltransferase
MNSGVLVIDRARWRQTHATERLLAFVRQRGSDLALHDQDAINGVLFDEIKTLDCRWNLQARMYRCGRRAAPHDYDATREARRRPAIIHYTGSEKP